MNKNLLYRSIPKVDLFLETPEMARLAERFGKDAVTASVREETDRIRQFIAACDDEAAARAEIDELARRVSGHLERSFTPNMRRVINATGTILHTNLGRAPLGRGCMQQLGGMIAGYCNLEYDLENGVRGERYSHFEELLCRLTGAEAAMAVNNDAAAVMLILSSLAKGGEVVVSRGELVEIGGRFRIPEVIEQSGARLVETGTTNKTYLSDYENAVTEDTRALLKVHTSNYRIVGFSELVPASEMKKTASKHGIPVIEDLGSGLLVDLRRFGCDCETVQDSVRHGSDVICFSGDKLLGGPQAGIIIGRRKYIEQMKKNQLARAVRIDKFTAAALELTLMQYQSEEMAFREIPVLRMISESEASVRSRAQELAAILEKQCGAAEFSIEECESQFGGGSLPLQGLGSTAVVIKTESLSADELERRMRGLPVPIIPRICENSVRLDMRTIDAADHQLAADEITELIGRKN